MVELTNHCNFRCPFCPSNDISRDKGYIEVKLADKILKEISEKKLAKYVQFGIMGEPFLHKELIEMLKIAEKYSLKIRLFTNGSLLSADIVKQLLNVSIHELFVSYRAIEETGFKLDSSYDFLKYREQLKNFLSAALISNKISKIYLKVFKKSLYANFVKTEQITDKLKGAEVEKFMEDFFDFLPKKISFDKNSLVVNHDMQVEKNIFVRFETIAAWNSFESIKKGVFYKGIVGACDGLDSHFGILWNGDLTTCCKDYDGKNRLGNIRENSIVDILNSSKTRKIKRSLKYCYLPTEYCRVCRGGDSIWRSLVHQLGSIIAYKVPFVRKRFLKM